MINFYLIRLTGSVKQSLINFLVPVFSLFESILILEEYPENNWNFAIEIIGCICVIISIFLIMRMELPTNDNHVVQDVILQGRIQKKNSSCVSCTVNLDESEKSSGKYTIF